MAAYNGSREDIRWVFDGVLVRNARELQEALRLMRAHGASEYNEYVLRMRQDLHRMELELRRRGLHPSALRSDG